MPPAKLVPVWQLQLVECDTLLSRSQSTHQRRTFECTFLNFRRSIHGQSYYTGTSRSQASVSSASLGPSFSESNVLHLEMSIFTAEAHAVLLAVKHIGNTNIQRAIIITDSKYCKIFKVFL